MVLQRGDWNSTFGCCMTSARWRSIPTSHNVSKVAGFVERVAWVLPEGLPGVFPLQNPTSTVCKQRVFRDCPPLSINKKTEISKLTFFCIKEQTQPALLTWTSIMNQPSGSLWENGLHIRLLKRSLFFAKPTDLILHKVKSNKRLATART